MVQINRSPLFIHLPHFVQKYQQIEYIHDFKIINSLIGLILY